MPKIPSLKIEYKDRFENLFPSNVFTDESNEVAPLFIVRLPGSEEPCCECGDLTEWAALDFEAPVCSIQCWTNLNIGYINALRRPMRCKHLKPGEECQLPNVHCQAPQCMEYVDEETE